MSEDRGEGGGVNNLWCQPILPANKLQAVSSNCIVLICPNEPREKKVLEFEQTKARGEHTHRIDNQTPFNSASCLIYTV